MAITREGGRPAVHASSLVMIVTGALVVVLGIGSASVVPEPSTGAHVGPAMSPTVTGISFGSVEPALPETDVAALPEARYDAVIAGLIGYAASTAPSELGMAYSLRSDTAIYGVGRRTAVARFSEYNFLGEKSVVVVVSFFAGWALVLTPARQALPSESPGRAPAQSAGWIPAAALSLDHPLIVRIVVSVSGQSLTIVDRAGREVARFSIGVGTPSTPTPTGVTGYLQARYLDPAQGQETFPINLTSLHSSAADEPYGGNAGGLIGVHFFAESSGAISHGCLRLPEDAIVAVNRLPLGTPITIIP